LKFRALPTVGAAVIVLLFLIMGQVWASSIQRDWKANEDSSTSAPQQAVSAEWAIKDASITQVRLMSFLCAMVGGIAVLFFAMARQSNESTRRATAAYPVGGESLTVSAEQGAARAPTAAPSEAIDVERLARYFPSSYERALEQFRSLAAPPTNPQAWLQELCRRINDGSPPAAAASRIPLSFPES